MIYPCKLEDSAVIPVNDGTFETESLPMFERSWLSCMGYTFRIAFYSDAEGKNIVTPSAGTVFPEMEAIEGQWHTWSEDAEAFEASLCGAAATYTIPSFKAPALKGRVKLEGVEGAQFFRAHFVGN